jgi:simple sugar transport system ATP-binding protein
MKVYGLEVDPDAKIEDLSLGLQQRVEIIKGIYGQANILILDEPTAVLTPQETEDLFRIIRRLIRQGVAIVLITHRLKEAMKLADRISVMRRGRLVHTVCPADTNENELAKMMVGRDVTLSIAKGHGRPGDVVLDVRHLTVRDERELTAVRDVSFHVKAGEILGVAGVLGNGQTELAEALTGLRAIESGTVRLEGKKMPALKPRVLANNGLAHIPEDRLKHGLVLPYSIAENQILCSYYQPPFARLLHRNTPAMLERSKALIEQFDIRASGPLTTVDKLSGGNQQKVVVSRELGRKAKLLIANQPTRGLDVGSIAYIRRKIIEMRDHGMAVLLFSVDLDEMLSLSDRIAVLVAGRIVAIFGADKVTKDELGLVMTGTT